MSNKDDGFWDAYNGLTQHTTKEEARQLMSSIDAYYQALEEGQLNWHQITSTADAVHRRIKFLTRKYSIPVPKA